MRFLAAAVLACLASCSPSAPEVVVYTSVDEIYSREIFAAFEKETGVRVRAVYDAEEAKSLGLVHRIVAEASAPRCDVFWNGEAVRTVLLAKKGLLQPYRPASAEDVAAGWRDADDLWTGLGARSRVIVYRPDRVAKPPLTFDELIRPEWRGRVAMANPMFGTTAAHVAWLAQTRGEDGALAWLSAMKANGTRWVGGNSHVRDLVARGDCDLGVTDSDDVHIGRDRGDPIEMRVPEGTLAIPNTAALVKGAPHAGEGKRFLDFLLRASTEELLEKGRSRQTPVRRLAPPRVDWGALGSSEPFLGRVRKLLDL
jgi:iron(III) transport system substrate-binding protein